MLSSDELVAGAIEATGLSDLGDAGYQAGLDALIGSIESDAQVNEIGIPTADALITSALSTRLQVIDWLSTHPEVAEEQIVEPVFIVGVSRSGTTALSHLLSVDPATRSPRQWETGAPVPPPESATYETDERYLAAIEADENSIMHALNPAFKAMHHDPPNMPTECVTIMAQHMVSLQFNAMFHLPGYADFLLDVDHVETYEYHRRVLQLLQSQHPGQWVVKTPHHALTVEAIAEVYPDARFIWTHRDPATCIASTTSISCGLGSTFTDADHRSAAGKVWTRLVDEMLDRTAAARTRWGDRFIDVDYRDLVADPLAVAGRVYEELGRTLSPEAEARMATHVGEHVQHRWGRHTYTFDDFELDPDALNERHADYRAAYGLD
ncbi:MAG: hypothetical protein ACI9C1_002919 [Candidatus Aldehydirespiratoraceae bacterium]